MNRRDFMRQSLLTGASALLGLAPLSLWANERSSALVILERDRMKMTIPAHNLIGYAWIRWFLRDVMAGGLMGHPHPDLLKLLINIQREVGNRVITVHSGLRTPQTNSIVGGKHESRHLPDDRWVFRAVDFHVDGVRLDTLGQIARGLDARYVHVYDTWIHADVA